MIFQRIILEHEDVPAVVARPDRESAAPRLEEPHAILPGRRRRKLKRKGLVMSSRSVAADDFPWWALA